MASAAYNRLTYLLDHMDIAQISAITEIPSATVSYVLSQGGRIDQQYERPLRNLYQRTVYADLRKQGLSPTQARRFSWYSPNTVRSVESQTNTMVDTLVNKRLDPYIESLKNRGIYTTRESALDDLRKGIQDAIARSTLPTERLNELIETGESGVPTSDSRKRRHGTPVVEQ